MAGDSSLTRCFDGGVRYSFDVILFIHQEFSTAPSFPRHPNGKERLCWLRDSQSSGAGLEELPAALFSLQTIILIFCEFCRLLSHTFRPSLTPVPFHTKTHFLSQIPFGKPREIASVVPGSRFTHSGSRSSPTSILHEERLFCP